MHSKRRLGNWLHGIRPRVRRRDENWRTGELSITDPRVDSLLKLRRKLRKLGMQLSVIIVQSLVLEF